MKRVLAVIFLTALVACAKKPATETATNTTAEAPPLPADVAAVSATAKTDTTATTTSEASAIAEETGDTIVATGEFVSPTRSELSVKMPGRVAKMFVEEGSRVAKGQPVLQLETDYLRINLQRAAADVARAKAAEADASRDLDRKKDLIAKDSIPRATFDRSQAMFDQAVAARQSAEAQVSLLRQQLEDATLRSPINGVVAEKRTDVGQRLGEATVALVIVQTSPLKLRFRVPERYLAVVNKGDAVKASVDPYPNVVFEGRVTTVGGVIDPASRSLAIETEFPNRDGKLKPGLFARVEMAAR
jgi:membrane fusion protein (multidrug efflux system)